MNNTNIGRAAQRSAEAMLRALGGGTVALRLAAATQTSGTSGLGLASPAVEDVEISPAALRGLPGQNEHELLLPGRCVDALIEQRGFTSAEEMFNSALGVVWREKLLRITAVAADEVGGEAYLYRVTVVG